MQDSIVFVTGGSGFIGSEIIKTLCAKGFRIRALLRSTSSRENLKNMNFETIDGGIDDASALRKGVQGAHYVIHAAGVIFAKSREDFFKTNVGGTVLLAKICGEVNPELKRFLFVSSLAAAGPAPGKNAITESDRENPISHYGESKLTAEREIAKILKGKTPLTIIRPPAVYGPRDHGMFEFFKIVSKGIIPKFPSKNAENEKYLSLIYVDDLVEGILRATLIDSRHDLRNPKKYFLANLKVSTISEFLKEIKNAFGKKTLSVYFPRVAIKAVACLGSAAGYLTGKVYPMNLDKWREAQSDYWICSAEKAKKELGFESKMALEKGLQITTKWYQDHGWI